MPSKMLFKITYMSAKEVRLLHDGGEDPAGVGQNVGQEEVGVDLVPQAPQLSKYCLSNIF
jgi:hypothetical protein